LEIDLIYFVGETWAKVIAVKIASNNDSLLFFIGLLFTNITIIFLFSVFSFVNSK
jgi:hypothetical protein